MVKITPRIFKYYEKLNRVYRRCEKIYVDGMKVEVVPEPWFCDVCDRVFKTQKKLREHQKTHKMEDR